METRRHIFLTGSTGLIGRYLLRDFLIQGHRVTTLVRTHEQESSKERVEKALSFARLPREITENVRVLQGQLPDFQPDAIDRRLIKECDLVVHSAASLRFDKDSNGEPFRTNVEGTRNLVELVQRLGIRRWIQVSTAYVCGDTQKTVSEDHASLSNPRNSYEKSKRIAEELVRKQPRLDWTIVRPGIVVGDSRTGYTSTYQGMYRCLKSVALLVKRLKKNLAGTRQLPLRFHLSGNELTNLVPVDWVAEAISRIALLASSQGKHFHLTPRNPISAKALVAAVQEFFAISGIEFVGSEKTELENRNAFERIFDRETSLLGPYFNDDPQFDRIHLDEFLPKLREADVNSALIQRLMKFGESDGWGIRRGHRHIQPNGFDCAGFFESYFPEAARRSELVRMRDLNARIGFEIRGQRGGFWLCQLVAGDVVSVEPTSCIPNSVDFHYRTNCATLEEITSGRMTTREAFFEKRIEIVGNIERALLLALLFEDLLREYPYRPGVKKVASTEKACA